MRQKISSDHRSGEPPRRDTGSRSHKTEFIACMIMGLLTVSHPGISKAEDSPIQSPARPFGLEIVDTVQGLASDEKSADFQNNYLPSMREWGNLDLTAPSFTQLTSTVSLDPSKISLATQYDTRVYFVGENTTYKNTLGFNTSGSGITEGNPLLIFPDATEPHRNFSLPSLQTKKSIRSLKEPLVPGDFVNLGTLSAGTQLDFFLIADGARGGTDVFSTRTSANPDGLNHTLAFVMPGSPYLFVGFEDLYGDANGDFKDLLFAVDIGAANITALTNMPEPSTLLILGSFVSLVIYRKYTLLAQHRSDIT